MKHKNMTSQKMEKFYFERNLSQNTIKNYKVSIKHFEKVTNKTIDDMIIIAKNENKMEWEETQLYKWLTIYRNYIYNEYKMSSAKTHITRITTIFRHFKVKVGELSYFSTKQVKRSEEIDYEDLPNREILRKCINVKNPLLKALTLFMSSSGISRTDTYNLTIQDYLDATIEYHHSNDIHTALHILENSKEKIIPTFKLRRAKTGETYRTFASPESVRAINSYLLTREKLTNDSPLFKINFTYFNTIFTETNDLLGLGKINGRSRFTPQMLRSYHASQLSEAGVSDSLIDLLQGRKPQSIARKSYIRVKRERLKEEYIKALPYLVVEDINRVKTELESVKEENERLREDNEKINIMWEEFNNKNKRSNIWNELKGE